MLTKRTLAEQLTSSSARRLVGLSKVHEGLKLAFSRYMYIYIYTPGPPKYPK